MDQPRSDEGNRKGYCKLYESERGNPGETDGTRYDPDQRGYPQR